MLGTSRVNELIDVGGRLAQLDRIVTSLHANNTHIMYVIGGDGSMKVAHAISSAAQAKGYPLAVATVPKTMDNDVLWVWQSFGFLSAVEKAREIIDHIHTEVKSNPRLCILQLFGSDSGFVVSHAVLASATGHCDIALIPEVDFSMQGLAANLARKMHGDNRRVPYGLVVMAETAVPTDAMDYVPLDEEKRPKEEFRDVGLSRDEAEAIVDFHLLRKAHKRIEGQTSDELRSAGLKIVRHGLRDLLPTMTPPDGMNGMVDWDKLRVFTNEPRHILRAIPPSSSDIIIGQRLGALAVDNIMAGYTDFMISQWLTEFVLVPLNLVVLGRKRIPREGIFWKSVLAKTGQSPLA